VKNENGKNANYYHPINKDKFDYRFERLNEKDCDFIPTQNKVDYIQSLLRVGFDTIDFGSFVSPKAIPQMQDTAEVLAQLDLSETQSKLLAIIANTQGAKIASTHKEIQYLGFPFSISENFQMRNTHKTIAESLLTLQEILDIAYASNKEVVAYLSMGFGNPYGDPWNIEIVGTQRIPARQAAPATAGIPRIRPRTLADTNLSTRMEIA
jgi:hypothetical protein